MQSLIRLSRSSTRRVSALVMKNTGSPTLYSVIYKTGRKHIEMQELWATLPFFFLLMLWLFYFPSFFILRMCGGDGWGAGLCSVLVSRGLSGDQLSEPLAPAGSCSRDRTAFSILGGGLSLWH